MLFHCLNCPATVCFDCCPESTLAQRSDAALPEHGPVEAAAEKMTKYLRGRGCPSLASYIFYSCQLCLADFRKIEAAKEGGSGSDGGGSSSSIDDNNDGTQRKKKKPLT